jgi:hypothetical protein
VTRFIAPVAALAVAAGSCGPARAPVRAPVTVASAGVSNPTVALDPDGTPLIAWVGQDGNVFVARPGEQGAFDRPARANDVAGEAAPHEQAPAQVATGPEGHVYVIWQTRLPLAGRRFPASDLRFARSTDGGRTFAAARTVNDDAGGTPTSHTFHDLYVDGDGTVFVSWIDGRTTEARKMAGGAREQRAPAGLLREGSTGHHHGDAEARLGPEIRVARSTDGGRTFSASTVVDRDACPCCRTSLARGPDGTLYIAWRKIFTGDVRDVVVARSADGGASWDAPVRVHEDGWVYPGCPHAGPSIAVDSGGTLHVVWYTGAPGRAGLYLATSRDGARTFGPPQPLGSTGTTPVSHARVAAAGDGVWVAWEDRTAPLGRVALGRCGADGVARPLGDLPGQARSPAIAAGGATAAVAWLAGDTVRVAVAAAP